jgi:prephenate dehydratase
VTVEQDFHVFGVAPAASDTPIARVNAAQILEAHLLAALVEDRNNQTRVAAVKTDAQILPASETSEGGHEFERCGVVFLMVTIRWSSWLGV